MANFVNNTQATTLMEAIAAKFAALGGAMQYKGTVAFTSLPSPLTTAMVGNVYNISDDFTTTADFIEGAGKTYSAGTDVAIINAGTEETPSYKFNVAANFVDFTPIETRITNVGNSLADAFDDTAAYAIGDVVIYQDKLYKFTAAHTAGDWSASEVAATTVEDIVAAAEPEALTNEQVNALVALLG